MDRFGRLIETLWQTEDTVEVHSKFGRNTFDGVVWRQDLAAAALGVTTEDNFYSYDELYQVTEYQRGQLAGTAPDYTGITDLKQEEAFEYDPTGNWESYNSLHPPNSQTRTQNVANEITQIAASVGNLTPAYDGAGSMTSLPISPGVSTKQYTLIWDAWNRLISVKRGRNAVAQYAYDGLTRRINKTIASESRDYYYSSNWQVLEERVAGATTPVDRQHVWGIRDRSDLVQRLRSTGGGSLNEALFVLRDYLDPAAIADVTGTVSERYSYGAFGVERILAPDFSARGSSLFDWNFLFHGEFLDKDTLLYNYGFRYYNTSLGRWLSADPLGLSVGSNLYSFVKNCPTIRKDFVGLDDCAAQKSAVQAAKARYAAFAEQHKVDDQLLKEAFQQKANDQEALAMALAFAKGALKGIYTSSKLDERNGAMIEALAAAAAVYDLEGRLDDDKAQINSLREKTWQAMDADVYSHLELIQARKLLNDCLEKNKNPVCSGSGKQ